MKLRTVFSTFAIGALLTLIVVGAVKVGHLIYEKAGTGEVKQVLVLGDSIWDLVRDETGIAGQLSEMLDGKVQIRNLSIQGSSASDDDGEAPDLGDMVRYLTSGEGEIDPYYAAAREAKDLPEEFDVILLAYGLNDYYAGRQLKNTKDYFDTSTYEGALCDAVQKLKEAYPNAKVVILSPTNCQGYSYGKVIHEGLTYSFGSGTIREFVQGAYEVALSFDALFINNTEAVPISIHNGARYLVDGTHLTEEGRRLYAENLALKLVAAGYLE